MNCETYIEQYNAQTATPQQMVDYANCVNSLYYVAPEYPLYAKILVAVVILIMLGSIITGAVLDEYDRMVGALGGIVFGMVSSLAVVLLFFAVTFIFS